MALQFRNSGNSAVSLLCLQLQHDFEAKIALNSLQTFEEEKLQKFRRNNSVLRVHGVGCFFRTVTIQLIIIKALEIVSMEIEVRA